MRRKKIGLSSLLISRYLSKKGKIFQNESMGTAVKSFLDDIKTIIKIYVIARIVGTAALILVVIVLSMLLIRNI